MHDPTRTADPSPALTSDPRGTSTVDQDLAATFVPAGPGTATAVRPSDRYALAAELARGGMGVVCRATDTVFGREVAVKVLQSRFDLQSDAARRFADEARITAQLQHPAIPPVHDLGTLPDGRPFLAMKLIRGETLDHELKGRADPRQDQGRFVAAFEQVCQAVAYAHANRVIHRDLKPANVMLGSFGEVQVMDWGLAKLLAPSPEEEPEPPASGSDVRGARPADGDLTETGSVLGTPGFMPPEQAVGNVRLIGPRSDVFGLGGVLAVVLTGKPPFLGGSSELTRRMAAAGQVQECFARLDGSGADPELVALCKRCLNPDPAGRPADADEVARAVAGWRRATDERVRRAEEERAKADGRASEQRKRRRAQVALAAAVGLLAVGGGAVAWWADRQTSEQRTEELRRQIVDEQRAAVEARRQERNAEAVAGLLDLTGAALRTGDVAKAGPLLDAAAKRATEGGADDHSPRIARYRDELGLLRELDAAERFRWNMAEYQRRGPEVPATRRGAALRAFGADPDQTDPAAVARLVSAAAVRDQLVAALDRQLWFARSARVRAVLQTADPEPFRDAVRDAVAGADEARIAELAADPRALGQPSGFVAILGETPLVPAARRRELLTEAVARQPNDVILLMALGGLIPYNVREAEDERRVWYQAAVAVAPTNSAAWNNLGATLVDWREYVRAEAACREAIRLDPTDAVPHVNLGKALSRRGDLAGSEAAFREAIRIDPKDLLARTNLAAVLQVKGDLTAAAAVCRDALRLDPACAPAHANLGYVLLDLNDLKGAEAAHRTAIELWPQFAPAHTGLGNVLLDKGDRNGAEAEYREAIRLHARLPEPHFNLGVVLREKGNLTGAAEAHREALRLDPDFAPAHNGLGNALRDQGDLPAAIACFREAIRLRPKFAFAHNNLAIALALNGDLDESVAAFREALRIDPKNPGTAANLDKVLAMKAARDAKAKPRELAPTPRRAD